MGVSNNIVLCVKNGNEYQQDAYNLLTCRGGRPRHPSSSAAWAGGRRVPDT